MHGLRGWLLLLLLLLHGSGRLTSVLALGRAGLGGGGGALQCWLCPDISCPRP